MAANALLRPSEQAWQGALDNLAQRFSHLSANVVADTLRQNDGHAGRTAKALRNMPAPTESTPAPDVKAKEAPTQSLPAPAEAKAAPEVATTAPAPALVPRPKPKIDHVPEATSCASTVAESEAPPPPDSKLIFVAALQGDIQMLKCLITARADLNGRYTGRPNKDHADKIIDATPLHLVVTMGKADVAEVLLKHGADFEAKMRRALGSSKPPEEQYAEMTPLHLAAMEGHTNIVEMLIARGADKGALMQLTERKGTLGQDRAITPLQIAQEMAAKGHSRDSVISLLSR